MPRSCRCLPVVAMLVAVLAGAGCTAAAEGVTKAVGSEPAEAGRYPFQVALLKTDAYADGGAYPADEPLRSLLCAGTLLSESWVLTAAHCVAERSFDLEGPNDFPPPACLPQPTGDICIYRNEALVVLIGTQELLPEKGRRHRVKRIIVEPRYRETAQEHDIALIELARPTSFRGGLLIADPDFIKDALAGGWIVRAVGWGLVDESYGPNSVFLRAIDIPLQPYERCRERQRLWDAWVKRVRWSDINHEKVTDNMICAGWDGPPPAGPDGEPYSGSVLPNVCFGDSGGFVGLKDAQDRWVQIGIPSWQRDCETPYIPSVHTNVAAYRDWITKVTRLPLPLPVRP